MRDAAGALGGAARIVARIEAVDREAILGEGAIDDLLADRVGFARRDDEQVGARREADLLDGSRAQVGDHDRRGLLERAASVGEDRQERRRLGCEGDLDTRRRSADERHDEAERIRVEAVLRVDEEASAHFFAAAEGFRRLAGPIAEARVVAAFATGFRLDSRIRRALEAAALHAELLRHRDAKQIPRLAAAGRIEIAHDLAALGIRAGARVLRFGAWTGARIAAGARSAAGAVEARQRRAGEVPFEVAAIGVEQTDRFAARLVRATRGTVGLIARAARRSAAEADAQFVRKQGAGGVPSGRAADRIDSADGDAAVEVFAAGRRRRLHAGAARAADLPERGDVDEAARGGERAEDRRSAGRDWHGESLRRSAGEGSRTTGPSMKAPRAEARGADSIQRNSSRGIRRSSSRGGC